MGRPLIIENKLVAGQVLHDALKEFSEGKFDECFIKMAILIKANANDVNALFYSGMSAYYQKKYTEADALFQKVIASENNIFRQEATWFRAMTLLDSNKKEDAKRLLNEIVAAQGFYADKAEKQIEYLKQVVF
jgi:predicted Zn-dependent protease